MPLDEAPSRNADRWVERRKTSDFKSIVCRRRRRSGAWLRLSRAETISIEKLAGWVAGPLLNRLGRQVASRVWRTDSGNNELLCCTVRDIEAQIFLSTSLRDRTGSRLGVSPT